MIIMDTHVWVWWVQGDRCLSPSCLEALDRRAAEGIGVCAISCWEVPMLHIHGRLRFSCTLDAWLEQACAYPGVHILPLQAATAVNACRLPGAFHKDPADRMLVAKARAHGCRFVTADARILAYPHVDSVHPDHF